MSVVCGEVDFHSICCA